MWHSNVVSNHTDWLFNIAAAAHKWRLFLNASKLWNQVTTMLYRIPECSIRIKTTFLKQSGNYTAHVPPALTSRQSTPCAWFLSLVWSQQTAIIALNSFKLLVFVITTQCVFCQVESEILCIMYVKFLSQAHYHLQPSTARCNVKCPHFAHFALPRDSQSSLFLSSINLTAQIRPSVAHSPRSTLSPAHRYQKDEGGLPGNFHSPKFSVSSLS